MVNDEQNSLPGIEPPQPPEENVVDIAAYAAAAAKGGRRDPYNENPSEAAIDQGRRVPPAVSDIENIPDPAGERRQAASGHPSAGGANKGSDEQARTNPWAVTADEIAAASVGIPEARNALHGPSQLQEDTEEPPTIPEEQKRLAQQGIEAARRILGGTRRRIDEK